MSNNKKYIIVDIISKKIFCDTDENIKIFETYEDAELTCNIYELPNAWICELTYNHIEKEINIITMLTPLQKLYNEVKDLPCKDQDFKTKVIDRIFEIHGEEKYVIANAFNDGVCEHREDPERFLSGYEYFANTYNL